MSAWKDFVTASLLGTERGGSTASLPAALENTLGPAEELTPEARFLTRAGALALWRRTGWKPGRGEVAPPPVCPPDDALIINPTSAAHLRAMLDGHCAEVLPEWLGEAARLGKRVPPETLPALLEWARQDRARRPLATAAGGGRARWLATLNPAWNFAGDDAPEHWETGGREQRVAILRRWRETDPALALERLAAIWKTEPADARQAFLGVLAEAPCNADATFLEQALDDRSKDVRRAAADLLSRLPESPFVARMTARADALLAFKPGGLLKRATFDVTLPGDLDAAAKRDGLDPKNLALPRASGGEKAAVFAYTLAAVPLRHWTERFQQTPEVLLKTAARHDFAGAIITGWGMAAAHQRDAAWVASLLEWPLARNEKLDILSNDELFRVLPRADQVSRVLADMRANPLQSDVRWTYSADWPGYFHLLAESPETLPADMVRLMLDQLRPVVERTPAGLPYQLRPLADVVALKSPPPLLPEIAAGWLAENPSTRPVADRLAFRRDALAALAQP